jgi:hypothetical protein
MRASPRCTLAGGRSNRRLAGSGSVVRWRGMQACSIRMLAVGLARQDRELFLLRQSVDEVVEVF